MRPIDPHLRRPPVETDEHDLWSAAEHRDRKAAIAAACAAFAGIAVAVAMVKNGGLW